MFSWSIRFVMGIWERCGLLFGFKSSLHKVSAGVLAQSARHSYFGQQKTERLKSGTAFSDGLLQLYISMAEMADAGGNHGNAVFVRRCEDFRIAHRACWVDDGFNALRGNHVHAVAEGEEGIRSGTGAV